MWVNWTMSNGKQIEVEHITSHSDDTFYLVLYKAMPGNYTCCLFSAYSLGEPEDTAMASVINGSGKVELWYIHLENTSVPTSANCAMLHIIVVNFDIHW